MMSALSTADNAQLFRELASTIAAARDELCRLDGVIGDADHGIAMEQGFSAASRAIDALPSDCTFADQWNAAAKSFQRGRRIVGAALRNGVHARGEGGGCASGIAAERGAGVDRRDGRRHPVARQGGSRRKTMVDAWAPAASAAEEGMADGLSVSDILTRVREAANAGAESTKAMVATKGRSARLGERSIGHIDPGAASAAMVINVIAENWGRHDTH